MTVTLRSVVNIDSIVTQISRNFDYEFDGESTFDVPDLSRIPEQFNIGLIVGPSGTGKSSMLKLMGDASVPQWASDKAIVSHFSDVDDAQDRLSAVGFNTIPSWMRPYHVLSTGEKFRADMARNLKSNALVDEFTSVVDRNVAKSCSMAISKYIRRNNLTGLVFATCHYDIVEWLQPDWVFDTSDKRLSVRRLLQYPNIEIKLLETTVKDWEVFSHHHYLTQKINHSARCWVAMWGGEPVGFASALAYPSGTVKKAWREHRTVVLPDFQGLGIGMLISEAVGKLFVTNGCRYFSKTSHPRMGGYRNNSGNWRPTSKNGRARKDYDCKTASKEDAYKMRHRDRVCFSHEYIGKTEEL